MPNFVARAWRGMAPGFRKDLGFFGVPSAPLQASVLCESDIDAFSRHAMQPRFRCLSTAGARRSLSLAAVRTSVSRLRSDAEVRTMSERGILSLIRQVIIYPGEDGFWIAECPSLPGCISQGESRESAIANIREAIEGYVLALQEDGLRVPEERFEAMLVAV